MSDEDLTAESDDDTPVIKKLRAALKAQGAENAKTAKAASEALEKARGYEREKLFEEAGVPAEARGLLQRALAGEDDLTVDMIRAEATSAGLLSEPAPSVGQGERLAHEQVAQASGGDASIPTGIEDLIRAAATPEEVLRLAEQGGMPQVVQ